MCHNPHQSELATNKIIRRMGDDSEKKREMRFEF